MEHLIIYGKPFSGKSTLCRLLAKYAGYTPLLTGDLTRAMRRSGIQSLPTVMRTALDNLKPGRYCHDHLYVHTLRQLVDKGDTVSVVRLVDTERRPFPARHADKLADKTYRFNAQSDFVEHALAHLPDIQCVKVTNGPQGFDVSNLVDAGLVPFDCPVVLSVEDL